MDEAMLPHVTIGETYSSTQEYFDTYVRLLREHRLAALRRAVMHHRNTSSYTNIHSSPDILQPNPNPIRQCEMTVRNPVYEITLEKQFLRIARSSHCTDIAANFAAVLSELKACGAIVAHCGEQVNYSQMYVVGCDS